MQLQIGQYTLGEEDVIKQYGLLQLEGCKAYVSYENSLF